MVVETHKVRVDVGEWYRVVLPEEDLYCNDEESWGDGVPSYRKWGSVRCERYVRRGSHSRSSGQVLLRRAIRFIPGMPHLRWIDGTERQEADDVHLSIERGRQVISQRPFDAAYDPLAKYKFDQGIPCPSSGGAGYGLRTFCGQGGADRV